jgi:hypothetical protein
MEVVENFMPLSIVACIRASTQSETNFLDSIPSLRFRGMTKLIKKKPIFVVIPTRDCNMSYLPEDTIIHIFSYLTCRDLINLSEVKKNNFKNFFSGL